MILYKLYIDRRGNLRKYLFRPTTTPPPRNNEVPISSSPLELGIAYEQCSVLSHNNAAWELTTRFS